VKTKKTIILTGTHHTPAIEIIKQLQKDPKIDWQIHYISHTTSRDTHLSNTIIPLVKPNYYNIACGKFHRRSLFDTIMGIPATFAGFFQSIQLINRIKPNLVISFGGYASVPVIITSYLFRVPSITHEQTLTVSLATRINAFFSTKIALTFDETNSKSILPINKIVVTGNPVRTDIYKKTSSDFSFLETTVKKRPLIYITGGSQGSEFINQLIVNILTKLSKFTVIHQTGQSDLARIKAQTEKLKLTNYYPINYVNYDNIGWVLNHADIVIARSGANNCLDFHVLNKKAILIPLPIAQQNEQLLNAQWLQKHHPNQIIICPQSEITPEILLKQILKLYLRPSQSKKISPPKVDPLFQLIHDLI
jgi:UDP-N-acetylglucosamine--N-acetylmuramyl-(pentapeptide) pyrophosphoryl-undecaprenol N-acetylglucosamine transferase